VSQGALVLVLTAALAHAAWNLAAKRAGPTGVPLVWLAAAVSTVLFAPVAVAAGVVAGTGPGVVLVLGCLVSGALHVAYYVTLQRGYGVGDLSVVYPLARGTGPLLAVLVAVLALGEHPGPLGIAGAALVVGGVLVVSGSGGSGSQSGTGLPTWRVLTDPASGAAYGVATGVSIAAYTLWDAHAVGALALAPVVYLWGNDLTRCALLSPYAWRHRSRVGGVWRAYRREVLAIAVLSPLAYLLVLFAFRLAPVSLVAPAREMSIIVGALAGWLLLGEPNPGRRLAGAVVVLGGVAALALA